MPEDTKNQHNLDIRVSNVETSVSRLEERFDNLELQNRASAKDIMDKFDLMSKSLHETLSNK